MRGLRYFLSIFVLTLPILPMAGQDVSKLRTAVENLGRDSVMLHGSLGFCLVNTSNGKKVYSYNEGQSLIPASGIKLLTTSAALGTLGPGYVFRTKLGYKGYIDSKGVLHGQLVISGSGDPTLGSDRVNGALNDSATVKKWVEAIKAVGISRIEGGIEADASCYEELMQPPGWCWNDIGNYYGAGACGLNFRENLFFLKLSRNGIKAGQPLPAPVCDSLSCIPRIVSSLKAGPSGSGDQAYFYGSPFGNTYYLSGTIPEGNSPFTVKGSLPNPALFCAAYLAQALKEENITQSLGPSVLQFQDKILSSADSLRTITINQSPPLKDIVAETNLHSINLYAETLLKEMGKQLRGAGSTQGGIRVVKDYWKKLGLDTAGLFLTDGCGLSPFDGISATQFCQALTLASKQPYFVQLLRSLPVAGKSGAMAYYGKGTSIAGKVHAKTGHMERVRCYAGYFQNSAGDWMAFAFMINNYDCSSAEIKTRAEKVLVSIMSE